jgi:predicted ATPase
MPPRLIVVTGAPGTGKTAILNALAPDMAYVREPAREVLAEQRAICGKGTAESDPSLFVRLLLGRSIEKHQTAVREGRPALFDRGVPDCVAYAHQLGGDPEPCRKAAALHRYERTVLVARPWEDIYTTDDERKMTFAATLPFQRLIEEAYLEAGYELLEIPRGPLHARVDFVARFTSRSSNVSPESRE